MAILHLSMEQSQKGCFTLVEHGELYDQLSRFRTEAEVARQLSILDLEEWQIKDLWDGKDVELDSEHSWPACG